MKPQKF